jgi:hypothetical protein
VNVERLWRVRKDSHLDRRADRRPIGEHDDVPSISFSTVSESFSREFSTRALATAEARSRLRDLQPRRWTTHW